AEAYPRLYGERVGVLCLDRRAVRRDRLVYLLTDELVADRHGQPVEPRRDACGRDVETARKARRKRVAVLVLVDRDDFAVGIVAAKARGQIERYRVVEPFRIEDDDRLFVRVHTFFLLNMSYACMRQGTGIVKCCWTSFALF